jgi:hypothetical protein
MLDQSSDSQCLVVTRGCRHGRWSLRHSLRLAVAEEGWRGLYRGFTLSLCMCGIQGLVAAGLVVVSLARISVRVRGQSKYLGFARSETAP